LPAFLILIKFRAIGRIVSIARSRFDIGGFRQARIVAKDTN